MKEYLLRAATIDAFETAEKKNDPRFRCVNEWFNTLKSRLKMRRYGISKGEHLSELLAFQDSVASYHQRMTK